MMKELYEYHEQLRLAPPIADCHPSISEYMNDVEQVQRDAIAAGIKGEPYYHYHMTKRRFNGKISVRHKPLNNADLYAFAKRKFSRSGESDGW